MGRLAFIHSFIHYGDLYSAPSRLLLRSAPDPCTAKEKSFEARVKFVRKNVKLFGSVKKGKIVTVTFCLAASTLFNNDLERVISFAEDFSGTALFSLAFEPDFFVTSSARISTDFRAPFPLAGDSVLILSEFFGSCVFSAS